MKYFTFFRILWGTFGVFSGEFKLLPRFSIFWKNIYSYQLISSYFLVVSIVDSLLSVLVFLFCKQAGGFSLIKKKT